VPGLLATFKWQQVHAVPDVLYLIFLLYVGKRKATEEHKPATYSRKDEILILNMNFIS
jgi:hypothetical protein